jgi:NADPH:quinone reductase-like Zn-dependent oxidoreductase
MRAFAIDHYGDTRPHPGITYAEGGPRRDARACQAAGVNAFDLKVRAGGKPEVNQRFPLILGQDAAGIVEEVGAGVGRFAIGSAVFGGFWLSGSFAEFVRVPMKSAVAR